MPGPLVVKNGSKARRMVSAVIPSPVSETESRINLQVHPAGGETYLPGATQLRLLTPDGSEIGKVSAAVTETIQLQFRVSAGEQFEIEIACCGQILTERFEV